nr:MAG TPA: hypothetical protein [Caudoviricetes sp.]
MPRRSSRTSAPGHHPAISCRGYGVALKPVVTSKTTGH